MEKRNSLLLTIIAIATLIVAVIGATFAYYASTVNNQSGINTDVKMPSANGMFTTQGGEVAINTITTQMMSENEIGSNATASSPLKISYLSGSTNENKCTYNIYYMWIDGKNGYSITDPNQKEFTYFIKEKGNIVKEENLVEGSNLNRQLIASKQISNASVDTPTINEVEIGLNWYNINADQSINADKNFQIRFFVDDIVC